MKTFSSEFFSAPIMEILRIPRQYILLGETRPGEWHSRLDQDVKIRISIGRLYYGVFLIAKELLGIESRKGSAHQQVISRLSEIDKSAGKDLGLLLRLRNCADYALIYRFRHRDLRKSRERARRVVRVIERHSACLLLGNRTIRRIR